MSSLLLSQQVAVALQRSLAVAVAEPEALGASGNGGNGNDSDASAMTCSICLQHPALEQIASVKGCDHAYCVKCILRWAAHREAATCPQCKLPFDTVTTYQQLDGSLWDFPHEESVVLLKRAHWFTDYMQEVEKGGAWRLSADDGAAGFADYDPYYQEFDDDEEVEDYYFSAAAGRARIVLGNRRLGENGYIASGRRQARPARQQPGSSGRKKKGLVFTAAPSPAPAAARDAGRDMRTSPKPGRAAAAVASGGAAADEGAAIGRDGRLASASAASGSGSGTNEALHSTASPAGVDRLGRQGSNAAAAASSNRLGGIQATSTAAARACGDRLGDDSASTANGNRPGAESSSDCPIPLRSNRRPGGAPATSSYRSSQHQLSDCCQHGKDGGVAGSGTSPHGSSPCSCSPLGSSPGTGRRAKRNLRRTLDDEMAALHM